MTLKRDPQEQRVGLQRYIAEKWSDPELTIRDFRELSDGWSRGTYALTVERQGKPLPLIVQVEREHGPVVDSRVARDFSTLKVLEDTPVPSPRPYLVESDPSILGGPFVVVERMEGACFDMFSRKDRSALEAHWKSGSALPSSVVDVVLSVHRVPRDRFPFLSSAPSVSDTPAWEIERCRGIARQIGMDRDPFVATTFRWLERHAPAEGCLALVHGDYHLRNLLISGDRVSGLLDWELTRISDPLFDVAYMCIPYLSGKFFSAGSPHALGMIPVDWLVKEYGSRSGREIDPQSFRFWRVLATLSLLLIISTSVSAFEKGMARDIRSAWLRFVEPVLEEDLMNLLCEKVRTGADDGFPCSSVAGRARRGIPATEP